MNPHRMTREEEKAMFASQNQTAGHRERTHKDPEMVKQKRSRFFRRKKSPIDSLDKNTSEKLKLDLKNTREWISSIRDNTTEQEMPRDILDIAEREINNQVDRVEKAKDGRTFVIALNELTLINDKWAKELQVTEETGTEGTFTHSFKELEEEDIISERERRTD